MHTMHTNYAVCLHELRAYYACATDDNAKRPTSGYQRNGPWFRARSDGRTRVEAIYKIDAVYLTTPDPMSVVHVLLGRSPRKYDQ